MDKNYVQNKSLVPVFDLGVSSFKSQVVLNPCISEKLKDWIMENIQKDRNSQMMTIDKILLKNVIGTLAEISKDKSVYISLFENPFIEQSRSFFAREALELVMTDSCTEFLKKVEKRLKEEKERVEALMDPRTEGLILKVVDDSFIKTHSRTLAHMENSGCIRLMDNMQIIDLNRMFLLFSRVPDSLKEISSCLSISVERELTKVINSDHPNHKQFITELLKVREKYETIVNKSFEKDAHLQTVMKLSFENCINKNKKTVIALTRYADVLQKKELKSLNDNETDAIFNSIILLFRYLNDKDIFESLYKEALAVRLLAGSSLSDESEKLMVKKLKVECGSQYTSKMEGMINDMKVAKDVIKDCTISNDFIEFKVLTSSYWPQSQIKNIVLPVEISGKMERFKRLYLSKYSGRNLTWGTNLGTAEIRAFLGRNRTKHELIVSTYQMAVLLLFNERNSFNFESISQTLCVDDVNFDKHVLGLVKSGVLIIDNNEKKLEEATVVSLNEEFKNRMFRIKVPVIKTKEKVDTVNDEDVPEIVESDRKHMIEAAIVKIMKSRRQMPHSLLIAEVTKMVSWKFIAGNKMIKGRIENLIEREFIQRDQRDNNLYLYVV
jgi:cullin 3